MEKDVAVPVPLVIISIILCGYGQSAMAGSFPAPGSGIATESYNPTENANITATDSGTSGSIKSTRTEGWLLAPIPAAVLNGMVTIRANLKSDTQKSSFLEPRLPDDSSLLLIPQGSQKENRNVTTVGFSWHPHHKEGAPRYYLAAERTGLPDPTDTIRPLSSYTVGSDVGEDDLPIPFNFSATDITETKIYFTWHRFTGYNRFDVGAGHKIKTKNGLVLDLLIPRHFLVGWSSEQDSWYLYGGLGRELEYLPWFDATAHGWSEDLREKRKIGVRVEIFRPVYFVFEAGLERQTREQFDYDGNRAGMVRSEFAPFARLAIESWHQVL